MYKNFIEIKSHDNISKRKILEWKELNSFFLEFIFLKLYIKCFNPQKNLLVNLVIISLEAKSTLYPTEFVLIKFFFRCIWLCIWLAKFFKNVKFIINKDFTVQPGVLCFFLGRKEELRHSVLLLCGYWGIVWPRVLGKESFNFKSSQNYSLFIYSPDQNYCQIIKLQHYNY